MERGSKQSHQKPSNNAKLQKLAPLCGPGRSRNLNVDGGTGKVISHGARTHHNAEKHCFKKDLTNKFWGQRVCTPISPNWGGSASQPKIWKLRLNQEHVDEQHHHMDEASLLSLKHPHARDINSRYIIQPDHYILVVHDTRWSHVFHGVKLSEERVVKNVAEL